MTGSAQIRRFIFEMIESNMSLEIGGKGYQIEQCKWLMAERTLSIWGRYRIHGEDVGRKLEIEVDMRQFNFNIT